MTLHELVHGAGITAALPATARDAVVTGIACDSREIEKGGLFVALKGEHFDGTAFADDARGRGASAIVAETEPPSAYGRPWVTVPDARAALAALAATFYGDPSHELLVVGTTGTNGKTTTTYLIESILEHAGIPSGRIGSVAYRIAGEEWPATRTTPEAPELQALLRQMVERGCRACVMEVSSHALALKRADRIRFGAAVYTNLTRDHLDFHGDMTRYFQAKQRLFDGLPNESPVVINADDPRAPALISLVAKPITYAIDSQADVVPNHLDFSLDGITLGTQLTQGSLRLRSRLLGRGNAYNILAAVTVCAALDLPFRAIEQGVAALAVVPGRLQAVSDNSDDVAVIVDYAHTDDALRNLLETVKSLSVGRVITVFGCGGDRDRTKRPLMGAVAARLSDLVVITSDNPRSEDPLGIITDIERGLGHPEDTPWLSIAGRAEAIEWAIREAHPGDLVVIAGKGHERYQLTGTRALPFEDAAVAREELSRRRTGSRVG